MISVAMQDANDFVTSVIVENETYKLHFGWNSNAEQWSVDVRTISNVDIGRGIAVVPNFPLLNQGKRNGFPVFEMMAVVVNDDDPDNQKIGRDDFINGKFNFVLIPRSEQYAIKSATLE